MGREVRMVPKDYQHPREGNGEFKPLFDGKGFEIDEKRWLTTLAEKGLQETLRCEGNPPNAEDYMLVGVPEEERTHYMMFEDTSEGTPKSPAFTTKEELVDYLVKHKVSYFGYEPASRDVWERVVDGGFGGMMFVTRTQ